MASKPASYVPSTILSLPSEKMPYDPPPGLSALPLTVSVLSGLGRINARCPAHKNRNDVVTGIHIADIQLVESLRGGVTSIQQLPLQPARAGGLRVQTRPHTGHGAPSKHADLIWRYNFQRGGWRDGANSHSGRCCADRAR